MDRRQFRSTAAPAAAAAAAAAQTVTRPNIVFFMVDQLSMKWIEGGARKLIPTPNLDRLQQRGVTFTQAFSSNPICCPTRATLAIVLRYRRGTWCSANPGCGLFHLTDDPDEQRNLARAADAARMRTRASRHSAGTSHLAGLSAHA